MKHHVHSTTATPTPTPTTTQPHPYLDSQVEISRASILDLHPQFSRVSLPNPFDEHPDGRRPLLPRNADPDVNIPWTALVCSGGCWFRRPINSPAAFVGGYLRCIFLQCMEDTEDMEDIAYTEYIEYIADTTYIAYIAHPDRPANFPLDIRPHHTTQPKPKPKPKPHTRETPPDHPIRPSLPLNLPIPNFQSNPVHTNYRVITQATHPPIHPC